MIKQRDEALQQMIAQYNEAAQTLQHLAQENEQLKSSAETQVCSVKEVDDSSSESVISSLRNEIKILKERENELHLIKVSYEQLQKELDNLKETVKLKDESLQQMAAGLASGISEKRVAEENIKEVERLRAIVIEREKTLKEFHAQLNIKEQTILSWQVTAEQKDHQLKTLHGALDQKEQSLQEKVKLLEVKEQSLKQKDESLQQVLTSISDSGDQVSSLHAELEILRQKEQQYIEQEEQFMALHEIVNSLKAQLQASRSKMLTDSDIGELGKELETLKEALRQKDISLQQMSLTLIALQKGEAGAGEGNAVLEQLQENLTQKDNALKEISVTVSDLQNQVTALTIENKVLKDSSGAATGIKDQLNVREKEVHELKEALKNKDTSLQQMAKAFKEYENEMAVIHKRNSTLIEQKDEKISTLEEQMKLQDHELAVVSQELENMKVDSEARQTKSAPAKENKTKEQKHEKEVKELMANLEKQRMEMEKLSELLKQREQSLQQMSSQYSDLYQQFSEVSDENSFLKEGREEEDTKQKEKLQQLYSENTTLRQRESELISTIKELADREDQYQKLDEVIEMKDKSLHQLSQRLAEMTSEFDHLTEENRKLKEKQDELKALNESYNDKGKEVEGLQQAIKQKDQSIISLIEKCEELSRSVDPKSPKTGDSTDVKTNELEKCLTEREAQIESLQQVMAEKIEQLQEKESEVQSLQEIVKSRDMIFEDMNERYDALSEEFKSLQEQNVHKDASMDQSMLSQLQEAKKTIEQKEKLIQQLCDENSHLTEQVTAIVHTSPGTSEPTVPIQTVESVQLAPNMGSAHNPPQVEEMRSRIKQLEENIAEREAQIDQLCVENSALIERLAVSESTVTIPTPSESLESRLYDLERMIEEKDRLMEKIHKENVKLANIDRPPKLDSDTTYQIQVLQGKLDEKEKTILDLETTVGEKEALFQQACSENSELLERLSSNAASDAMSEAESPKLAKELLEKEEKIKECEHVIELKEQLIEQLYKETDHLNTKLQQFEKPTSDPDVEINSLKDELKAVVEEKLTLEKMLCTRDENQSSIQQSVSELSLKLKTVEQENDQLREQIHVRLEASEVSVCRSDKIDHVSLHYTCSIARITQVLVSGHIHCLRLLSISAGEHTGCD